MATDKTLDRLIQQLTNSPTTKADQPLWQVITQLIRRVKALETQLNSSSGSGSSVVNNITEQTFIIQSGGEGDDGEMGPPGVRGLDGAMGIQGPVGPPGAPIVIAGEDGSDGYPIPGPQGIQGATGTTGPVGPPTIGPMGIDGEDGLDQYFGASSEFPRVDSINYFRALNVFKLFNITPFDNGNSGAAKTIDWSVSNTQYMTLDNNCTLTFSNPIDGLRMVFLVKGGFTITWPASVEWPGGTAPTISGSGSWDLFTFLYKGAEAKYVGSFNLDYTL